MRVRACVVCVCTCCLLWSMRGCAQTNKLMVARNITLAAASLCVCARTFEKRTRCQKHQDLHMDSVQSLAPPLPEMAILSSWCNNNAQRINSKEHNVENNAGATLPCVAQEEAITAPPPGRSSFQPDRLFYPQLAGGERGAHSAALKAF